MNIINSWFERFLGDRQLVYLVAALVLLLVLVVVLGHMLAPAIAALIIAFLLDGAVEWLRARGIGKLIAVIWVFVMFIALCLIAFFTILPPIMGQFAQFFGQLPTMLGTVQEQLYALPQAFPSLVDESQLQAITDQVQDELMAIGQRAVAFSLGSIVSVIALFVYVILVPVMVFFFLKDKDAIISWIGSYLPRERQLTDQVWDEVMLRTGDYARGKVYEILIVGFAAWLVFSMIGLKFAAFLALITGLSVIVPFIGAAVVTIPVAFVALFQWGPGSESLIAVMAYLILQALDGNVLVPLLFSEVVKLHPNAIILAVLVFGGIWGLWGVFFAIPLATLAHAVIKAWRSHRDGQLASDAGAGPGTGTDAPTP